MEREDGYRFRVDFNIDDVPPFYMDEPEPVGEESGPNASKVLAATLANCLSASLLFCLQKSRVKVGDIRASSKGTMRRNEEGRWRIAEMTIEITPEVDKEYESKMERCIQIFEDYCVISQSVREGIPLDVRINWD